MISMLCPLQRVATLHPECFFIQQPWQSPMGLEFAAPDGVGVLHVPQGECLNSYDVFDTFTYIYIYCISNMYKYYIKIFIYIYTHSYILSHEFWWPRWWNCSCCFPTALLYPNSSSKAKNHWKQKTHNPVFPSRESSGVCPKAILQLGRLQLSGQETFVLGCP